ncbi:MAG TPA: hypothetical protein VKU44_01825 [Terriglobia bacterium]|nr:hypothetical protein [Terriglobia bacterium]
MITFHKTLAGCEAGDAESWRAFLSDYTPLVFHLADFYLPGRAGGRSELWRETLVALMADGLARWRAFDRQAEREFLADLRTLVLEQGAKQLDRARDATGAPAPSAETVKALLQGLPILHQQVLFLKLAGYSDLTLESMLRIAPSIAAKGLERLRADYGAILGKQQDVCGWPAAWSDFLAHARAARTEQCPPLRQFVRIRDGQTGWQDKEPLEKHMAECVHCLERWTALAEIVYWRREARPCPPEEIRSLLASLTAVLGTSRAGAAKKSLLKRMFGA